MTENGNVAYLFGFYYALYHYRRHIDHTLCRDCERKRKYLSRAVCNQDRESNHCSSCSEKLDIACSGFSHRVAEYWSKYFGNERGWWWAVDFTRRVVLAALYVFIQD